MINPRLFYRGDAQLCMRWASFAKKKARQLFDIGILHRVLRPAEGVVITIKNTLRSQLSHIFIEAEQHGGFLWFPMSEAAPWGWYVNNDDVRVPYPLTEPFVLFYTTEKRYAMMPVVAESKAEQKPWRAPTLHRDVKRFSGNQFYFQGNSVYSWWGSPYGDAPLFSRFHAGITPENTPCLNTGFAAPGITPWIPEWVPEPFWYSDLGCEQPVLKDWISFWSLNFYINGKPFFDSAGYPTGWSLDDAFEGERVNEASQRIDKAQYDRVAGVFPLRNGFYLVVQIDYRQIVRWYVHKRWRYPQPKKPAVLVYQYASPYAKGIHYLWSFSLNASKTTMVTLGALCMADWNFPAIQSEHSDDSGTVKYQWAIEVAYNEAGEPVVTVQAPVIEEFFIVQQQTVELSSQSSITSTCDDGTRVIASASDSNYKVTDTQYTSSRDSVRYPIATRFEGDALYTCFCTPACEYTLQIDSSSTSTTTSWIDRNDPATPADDTPHQVVDSRLASSRHVSGSFKATLDFEKLTEQGVESIATRELPASTFALDSTLTRSIAGDTEYHSNVAQGKPQSQPPIDIRVNRVGGEATTTVGPVAFLYLDVVSTDCVLFSQSIQPVGGSPEINVSNTASSVLYDQRPRCIRKLDSVVNGKTSSVVATDVTVGAVVPRDYATWEYYENPANYVLPPYNPAECVASTVQNSQSPTPEVFILKAPLLWGIQSAFLPYRRPVEEGGGSISPMRGFGLNETVFSLDVTLPSVSISGACDRRVSIEKDGVKTVPFLVNGKTVSIEYSGEECAPAAVFTVTNIEGVDTLLASIDSAAPTCFPLGLY